MTGEPRSRVAVLPDWYEDYFRFATLRFLGRVVSGRRIEGGKRTGKWTNGRVAALRWGVAGWLAYTLWLLSLSLLVCEIWLGLNVAVLVVWGGSAAFLGVKNWWLRDRILNPLHIALHEPEDLVGFPDTERPGRYLHVPLNWDKGEGAKVNIELRPGYANTDLKRDHFIEVVAATMGATIKPVDVSWRQSGKRPSVTIHPSWPPPKLAWFADNITRIEEARKPGEIVWGICDHDKLLKTSVTGETPHGAVVAQTGRGKTQTLAVGGCQLMHDGMVNIVLDVKGRSLPCFIDLPNAVYAGDPEEVDELLLKLETEFYRRRDLMKTWQRGQPKPEIGEDVLITVDESDSTFKALRDLHARRGLGRSNVPSISAFLALRNMGRQYKMRFLRGTQSGSAAAAVSGDSRSQDGWSLVSGDKPTWQKVSRDITKPPPISPIVGRWHLYRNGVIREVQIFGFPDPPKGTNIEEMEEAREYAMSGIVTPVPDNLRLNNTAPKPRFDTPVPNVSEPMISAGNGYVGPMSGTHVGDTPVPVPHLRLVGDAAGDRRAEWAGRIEAQIADLYADPPPDEGWLTLSEAMKAGIIPPKSMNAVRIAARKSELLSSHYRYREGPPTAGAKEYPRDVLVRYARGTVNA